MPAPIASPASPVVAPVNEAAASPAAPTDGQFAKVLQGQAAKNGSADNQAAQAAAPADVAPIVTPPSAAPAADPIAAILALLLPQAKRALGAAQPATDAATTAVPQSGDRIAAIKDAPNPIDSAWLPPGQIAAAVAAAAPASKSTAPATNGESAPAVSTAIDRWAAGSPANSAAATVEEATNALAAKGGNAPARPGGGADAHAGETFQAVLASVADHDAATSQSALQSAALASANNAASAAAQAAAAPAVQHGAPVLTVAAPMGSAAWSAEVGDKLTWMINHQEQRAELVLNPPHLGRIEVSLSLTGDQANAMFVSANPAVRDAIASAMPHLREQLAGLGVSLGQTQVGAESAGQSAQQRESGDNSWRGAGRDGLQDAAPIAGSASSSWVGRGRGMVDVFA
jgi:flagellar hook-length control protein FliK